MHPDKTCHIILADKMKRKEIEDEIAKNPLMYKTHHIKEKNKEKWLGDIKHKDGLSASIEATITERSGRIKIGIFESVALLEDTRFQILGGILGILEVWEVAMIPLLLNNCETWTEIDDKSISELESLQNLFFRMTFQVPKSCPKVLFYWDTNTLSMKLRIWKAKLNLYKYLQDLPNDTLAKEIFNEQKRICLLYTSPSPRD